jgi:hypothetical protein
MVQNLPYFLLYKTLQVIGSNLYYQEISADSVTYNSFGFKKQSGFMGLLQVEGGYTFYEVEITVFIQGDKNPHFERDRM